MFNVFLHCCHCNASKLLMAKMNKLIATPVLLKPNKWCEKCGKENCILVESIDSKESEAYNRAVKL